MKEEFKIDQEELSSIINQYNENKDNISEEEFKDYTERIIKLLGTDVLGSAINKESLEHCVSEMLNNGKFHRCYSNEDSLKMIEGISNYEIIGDWQYFLTVNSKYLFKLPEEMQEKFADNFSIGNQDAKKCLLNLWKNNIQTTGTDVIRANTPQSLNTITIACDLGEDVLSMTETIRKIITSQKYCYFLLSWKQS